MQPSTPPPLATSATSNRAAVGSGLGAVRRPRPAWAVCGGCRLKAAFPDRVRRPRSAWLPAEGEAGARADLASAGRSAEAPDCGQAFGTRLARTRVDLGRARCLRGNAKRMNVQAKDLSEYHTCFICDTDERGSGLAENLRLSSLNGEKMFEALWGLRTGREGVIKCGCAERGCRLKPAFRC